METASIPTFGSAFRRPPPRRPAAGLGPIRLRSRPSRLHFGPSGGPRLPGRRLAAAPRFAFRKDGDGSDFDAGRAVDEDMIVLRKRVNDMEMAERNYEPPAEWADWEKAYYTSYGAHVCEFVGLLQSLLLSTRPGLALGMLGLVALSVPVSAAAVVRLLIEMSLPVVLDQN